MQQNKNLQTVSFLCLWSGRFLWIQYSFKSFTKSARELNLPIEEFPFVQMVSFGRSLWCWQHHRGHICAQMDCSSSVFYCNRPKRFSHNSAYAYYISLHSLSDNLFRENNKIFSLSFSLFTYQNHFYLYLCFGDTGQGLSRAIEDHIIPER